MVIVHPSLTMRCTPAWCLVLIPSLTFKCLASFERLAYVYLHSLQSQQRELSSAMLRVIHSTIQAKTIHKHLHCSTPPRVIISGGCVAKSLRVSCKYNCSLDPVKGSYSKSSCAKLECFSCLFWNVTTLGINKWLWMSWHAETGATLSEKHVHSVGGVAFEARCWHGFALFKSEYHYERTSWFVYLSVWRPKQARSSLSSSSSSSIRKQCISVPPWFCAL